MKSYCIPSEIANKMKNAFTKGDISIDKLYGMSSEERRAAFQEITGKELAKNVNADFEKAMVSPQKESLNNWVKENIGLRNKGVRDPLLKKISELDNLGVLDPKSSQDFLADLVSTKLGVNVTEDEMRNIVERSKVLEDKFGAMEKDPHNWDNTKDYFRTRNQMDKYLRSINPVSPLRVATSIIGRGNLIFNLRTPLTNIISNTSNAVASILDRRINEGKLTGLNNDLIKSYIKNATQIYKETGYDVTRMLTLESGHKVLGEDIIYSEGKGVVRKIGRFYEDKVFRTAHGLPDVYFSSFHFADSANVMSTKMAKESGLSGEALKSESRRIFQDAMLPTPQTREGGFVKEKSVQNAMTATYQNDSNYAKGALKVREAINEATGDLRVGDIAIPFVKTVANVTGQGLDYAGVGAVKSLGYLLKGISQGTLKEPQMIRGVVENLVKTGIGLTGAYLTSMMFEPKDFIGAYPTTPKEQELLKLKNASPNSVLIGNKWVSLDYFGPFGVAMAGILSAKKYASGGDAGKQLTAFANGAGQKSLDFPGIKQIYDLYNQFYATPQKTGTKNTVSDYEDSTVELIRSRLTPSWLSDVTKATDTYQRETKGQGRFAKVKATIPGMREELPIKKTVFGDKVKTEDPVSTILFGSRLQTNREDKTTQELVRLDEKGYLPSISEVGNSGRAKELKNQLSPEKYDEFLQEFGTKFKDKVAGKIESPFYKNKTIDKKADIINEMRNQVLDQTLAKYKYKAPKKQKVTEY